MRVFASLLVIAAAVYIGYVVFTSRPTPSPEAPDAAAATGEVAAEPVPQAPAEPVFKSKIPIPDGPPGEKHYAPPNTFYMVERVTIPHDTGVAAAVPGEKVELVKRNTDGTMKVKIWVKTETYNFDVKESQVTNDLDLAREAERNFVLNPPKVR
jgi:hypothetical protein